MNKSSNAKFLRMRLIPFLVITAIFYVACDSYYYEMTLTPGFSTPPNTSVAFSITAVVSCKDQDDVSVHIGGDDKNFRSYTDGSTVDNDACAGDTQHRLTVTKVCNYSIDTGGYHTIEIEFWDRPPDEASLSEKASETLTIWIKATPTVTFVSPPTPSTANAGESVTLSVNVAYSQDGWTDTTDNPIPTPTGTFTITDTGGNTICANMTLDSSGNDTCSYTTSATTTLTATYNGDTNFLTATGQHTITVAIPPTPTNTATPTSTATPTATSTPAPTATSTSTPTPISSSTTIVSVFPDPPFVNTWVTVIVTVSDGTGTTPNGTVTITGADTNCTIDLTNGEDRCSVMFNSKGAKTLLATYSGTTGVLGSQGTLSVTVQKKSQSQPQPTPTDEGS